MERLHRTVPVAGALALLAALAAVPSATATTAAHAPSPSTNQPAPAGFRSQSTTWLDQQHGFLLGTAPCGDNTCTEVIATADGGTTWSVRGRVHASITRDGGTRPGVDEVRFSDAMHGWAFGPLLRHTSDGGKTWTVESVPGDLGQVLALATDADGTWAVVSPCRWQHSGACRKQPLTLWRTKTATSTTWQQVQADLPYNFGADVSAFGSTVYVTDPQLSYGRDDVLLVSTDGTSFTPRPTPCDHAQDIELIQVVATSTTNASMLCDGDPGFSNAVKIVYNTKDTGNTYRNRGTMGLLGIQAQLAASPSGNLAVASWSSGSFIYINDTRTKTWEMPVGLGDGGLGWNDIVYVTNTEAYVVHSPAGGFEGLGELWVTTDAGHEWHDVSP